MTTRGRVVLLHGQPGTGRGWRRVVAALDHSLDVIAPDRPGYGHNPQPAGGVHHNVEWVSELVDHDLGTPTVVVAHSWAGGPVLELGRRRPDAVHGLVLVASVGPGAITAADRILARPVFARPVPLRRRSVVRTFLAEQRALVEELPEVIEQIEQVVTPTIVVAGTRDRVVPFSTAEALAARLPNAELVPVERGGHPLHRTHPDVIADAVHRFLRDAPRQ